MPGPSGVVTFLFTDVEGSTRRWESDAAAMRVALAAHDDALRAAIETHGGWLFKHTGDGVCAAFASPRSAVDAAVTAQRALELPVRMGLATGALQRFGADTAIAITGIAGPGGGTPEKPVGTVCFSIKLADGSTDTRTMRLPGNRSDVRERSTTVAMHLLRRALNPEAG